MLKFLGNLMILGSAISMGLLMAASYRRRYHLLLDLRTALAFLEEEMLTLSRPLPEALQGTGERMDSEVRELFFTAAGGMQSKAGISFFRAWKRSLYETESLFLLRSGERRVLLKLGQSLGQGDKDHQRRAFKNLQLRMEQLEREARDQMDRYSKIWHYGGLLIGLMLVLILY